MRQSATHRSGIPEQGNRPEIIWHPLDMTQVSAVEQLASQLTGESFDAILINAGISGPAASALSAASDIIELTTHSC